METTNWLTKDISKAQINKEELLAILSQKILCKRTAMKMSQKEFAKFMGVSRRTIKKWESGIYNFSLGTVLSICEKLKLDKEEKALMSIITVPMEI